MCRVVPRTNLRLPCDAAAGKLSTSNCLFLGAGRSVHDGSRFGAARRREWWQLRQYGINRHSGRGFCCMVPGLSQLVRDGDVPCAVLFSLLHSGAHCSVAHHPDGVENAPIVVCARARSYTLHTSVFVSARVATRAPCLQGRSTPSDDSTRRVPPGYRVPGTGHSDAVCVNHTRVINMTKFVFSSRDNLLLFTLYLSLFSS